MYGNLKAVTAFQRSYILSSDVMQNLTKGLPLTEKAQMEGRLPASGRFSH